MGRPKQWIEFRGHTLVRNATRAALDGGCSPVWVVVGAHAGEVRRQIADLDYLTSSRAAMTSLAEQYVGLPAEVSFESAGL